MATLETLADEIDRVLSAHYFPSLKSLHDIVDDLSVESLQEWACFKPCQIYPLAALLREGLVLWPFCIDLLRRWTEVISFRDALLEEEPLILDKLIALASSAQDAADRLPIQNACVTILSNPLPDHVAFPDAAQQLIRDTLGAVAHKPSAASLRLVHQLFKGIKTTHLDMIPATVLGGFMQECRRVLKSSDDHVRPLLCLAIFAQINSGLRDKSPCSSESITSIEGSPQTKQVRREALDVLNGQYSCKMLGLVVMRAIHACSEGKNITAAEAFEHLRLGNEIMGSIDPGCRTQWVEANSPRIKKLCGKIVRPDIEQDIQLAALSLCCSLSCAQNAPHKITELCESILLSRDNVRLPWLSEVAFTSLARWMPFLSPDQQNFSEALTKKRGINPKEFILDAIDACRPGQRNTSESFRKLTQSLWIAKFLASVLPTDPHLCKILSAGSIMEIIPEWWDLDLQAEENAQREHCNCNRSRICPHAFEDLRTKVASQFSSLLLQASYAARYADEERSTALQCSARLTSCVAVSAARETVKLSQIMQSKRETQRNRATPTLVTKKESRTGDSERWKEMLRQDIMDSASVNCSKVVQFVGSVCQELEARCETIEEPLQETRARCGQLANEVQALQKRNAELQQSLEQKSTELEFSSIRNAMLLGEVENASSKNITSTREIEQLQAKIELGRSNAQEKISAAEQDAAIAEIDGKASIAILEEQLSCLQATIDSHSDEKEALRRALEDLQSESQKLREGDQKMIRSLEERVSAAVTEKCSISMEAEKRVCKLQVELKGSKEDLRSRDETWADREQSLQKELDAARNREIEAHAQFVIQLGELESTHEDKLRSMKSEVEAIKQQASVDLEQRDQQLRSLRNKLAIDTKKRKAQALELRDEKEFKRGLLKFIDPQRAMSKQYRSSRRVAISNDLAATPDTQLDAMDKEGEETPRVEKPSGKANDISPSSVTSPMAELFLTPKRLSIQEALGCGQTDRRGCRGSSSALCPQGTTRTSLGNANTNTAATSANGKTSLKGLEESFSQNLRPEAEVTSNHGEEWLEDQWSLQSIASDGFFDGDETAEL
ncbi:MAG: hypothetical protein Q9160_003834 [Pyrenula sp. 1 TL-2023]